MSIALRLKSALLNKARLRNLTPFGPTVDCVPESFLEASKRSRAFPLSWLSELTR